MSQRVALVTGGARRLGREVVLALAREGYDVFLSYLRSESAAHETAQRVIEHGRIAHVFRADLRDSDECDATARAALGLFGGVDLLVNSAAVFPEQTIDDVETRAWDDVAHLNLLAPLVLTRALADSLAARRGSVVNVGSLGGTRFYQKHASYSMSKAALAHLTRGLARRYAPRIRVNAVAPGTVALADDSGVRLPSAASIPLGRHATAEEVVAAILFVAEGSRYMTGQTLLVDGGQSIL